jgi:hypothetical protein
LPAPAAAALLWLGSVVVEVAAWSRFTSEAAFVLAPWLALWSAVVVDGVVEAAEDWSAVVLVEGAAAVVLVEGAEAVVEPVALWSAVPVVLVALPVEGAALVELALELIELWSAEVEVEGAAEVLLLGEVLLAAALWSAVVGAAEVLPVAALWSAVLGAAAELLAVVLAWSLLLVEDMPLEAEPDWQDSEIIFTVSTLKLLSACNEPVICTVLPLFALRSLVLPLSL